MHMRAAVVVMAGLIISGCSKPAVSSAAPPGAPVGFVAGTDVVKLGMTEAEVAVALKGGEPVKREEQNGGLVDLAFEISGAPEGVARARFTGGLLTRIEFWRTLDAATKVPQLTLATAEKIAQGPMATKAAKFVLNDNDPLTMTELLTATGGPGFRIGWQRFRGIKNTDKVSSTWVWQIDGGESGLFVEEAAGTLGQPLIRPMPSLKVR